MKIIVDLDVAADRSNLDSELGTLRTLAVMANTTITAEIGGTQVLLATPQDTAASLKAKYLAIVYNPPVVSPPPPPGPTPSPEGTTVLRGSGAALVDALGVSWTINATLRNGSVHRNGIDQNPTPYPTANVKLIRIKNGKCEQVNDANSSYIENGLVSGSTTLVAWLDNTPVTVPPPVTPPPPSPTLTPEGTVIVASTQEVKTFFTAGPNGVATVWGLHGIVRGGSLIRNGVDQVGTSNVLSVKIVGGKAQQTNFRGGIWQETQTVDASGQIVWEVIKAEDVIVVPPPVSPPPITPPPPPTTGQIFPLRLQAGKKYFLDASNNPFFLNGDTCWGLLGNMTREDVELYFQKRKSQGFNTIQIQLIMRWQSPQGAGRNIYGAHPFSSGQFTFDNPNLAYWDHVDWVVNRANQLGIMINIVPAFLGNKDAAGNHGELGQLLITAGAAKVRAFGQFIGNRMKNFPNVMWLQCGDTTPVEPAKNMVNQIALGIKDSGDTHLHSAHVAPGASPLDIFPPTSYPWMTHNTCYEYYDVIGNARRTYARGLPFFLVESFYENENDWSNPPVPTPPERIRRQYWEAVLGGASGQVLGTGPVWHVNVTTGARSNALGTWKNQLETQGARGVQAMGNLLRSFEWHRLVPMAVSGGTAYGAITDDGKVGVVYGSSKTTTTINAAGFASAQINAQWMDPVTGVMGAVTVYNRGVINVTPSSAFPDWVLVLKAQGPIVSPPPPPVVPPSPPSSNTTGPIVGQINLIGRNRTFFDDFNQVFPESGHNPNYKNHYYGNPNQFEHNRTFSGNAEAQVYTDPRLFARIGYSNPQGLKPVSVENSKLIFRAERTPADLRSRFGTMLFNRGGEYTSGMISTDGYFSQRYGVFIVRSKLPAGKGMWPAWWALNAPTTPGAYVWPPEIDFMETHGDKPTTLFCSTHYGSPIVHDTKTITVDNITTGFHEYACDWRADRIKFYFDGRLVSDIPTPAGFNSPMYLILNLAVGGSWAGYPDASTPFPGVMETDWIAVYN